MQFELDLDSAFTFQTNKRYFSTTRVNTEDLRTTYKVMTNHWSLAQIGQLGRHLYADFTKDTFSDFLDELPEV